MRDELYLLWPFGCDAFAVADFVRIPFCYCFFSPGFTPSHRGLVHGFCLCLRTNNIGGTERSKAGINAPLPGARESV